MSFELPITEAEVLALRWSLDRQADGTVLLCRGRDSVGNAWDYGNCMKRGEQLLCTYDSGDQECLSIRFVNLRQLFHVDLAAKAATGSSIRPQFRSDDGFLVCSSEVEDDAFRHYLLSQPEGHCFVCRGRDRVGDEWSSGLCQKQGSRLLFLYDDGSREALSIMCITFRQLIQLQVGFAGVSQGLPQQPRPGVAVIAHGFSPETGPDYLLIDRLASLARSRGLHVVIPDFRSSYPYVSLWEGHQERVRMLKSVLLRLRGAPFITLVGHSQGGRAAANVCNDYEVLSMSVRGCIMLGSEDPVELEAMRPMVPDLTIVHAEGDGIISAHHLRRRAALWGVPYIELKSEEACSAKDAWGDDIGHDFLAPDLFPTVLMIYAQFIERCAAMTSYMM